MMWKITATFLLLFLSYFVNLSKAAEIFYIEPYEIFPESEVTVKGSNFSKDTVVIFGDKTFKPFSVTENQIKFIVPSNTEPATYRLILKDKEGSTLPISMIVARKEVVFTGYTPDIFDLCSSSRELIVTGKNLNEIKKVKLNGKDINFSAVNSSLSLTVPEEAISNKSAFINIYFYAQKDKIVQLINVPINHKPVIEDIKNISSDFNMATYRITGKNFVSGLSLFVNNQVITEYNDVNAQQNTVFLQRGSQKNSALASPLLDRMQFNSCNEILYLRYPTTPDEKRLDIYIENPTGERSNTFTIFIP